MSEPRSPGLSRPIQAAVEDVAATLPVAAVQRAFTDQGFLDPHTLTTSGRPRPESLPNKLLRGLAMASLSTNSAMLARLYLNAVNWSSVAETLVALRAIEDLLWLFNRSGELQGNRDALPGERLIRHLQREGFRVDQQGRIHPAGHLFTAGSLASVEDPSLIRQILERITRALPDDPMLAIGSAKELIEATSKTVLVQLGQPVPPNANLPRLVALAERQLGIHPSDVDGQVDGGPLVRQLLGKLTAITDNLAALRNTYGTGHAPTALPRGLKPHHGRLAVAAADAWCTFMLDELAESLEDTAGMSSAGS